MLIMDGQMAPRAPGSKGGAATEKAPRAKRGGPFEVRSASRRPRSPGGTVRRSLRDRDRGATVARLAHPVGGLDRQLQLGAAGLRDAADLDALVGGAGEDGALHRGGATLGQVSLFALAKRGGREWLLQKPWFRIDESQLDRFDGWFQKWGRIIVPVSNALLFTRGMLTVPAGFAEMDAREFVVLSAIGSLLFQTWLALLWIFLHQMGFFSFL